MILSLLISVLAALLSIILAIFNWRINKNALYLSLFFLIFSTYGMSHYFTVYGNSPFWAAVFYGHFSPIWLLLGPLLYFYVRGTITDKQGLCWKDSWHFLPAILHFINLFPFLIQPFSYKLDIATKLLENINAMKNIGSGWIYPPPVSFVERSALLLIYSLFILYQLVFKYTPTKQNFSQTPKKQYLLTYRWLIILSSITCMVSLNFTVLTLSVLDVQTTIALMSIKPAYILAGLAFVLLPLSLLLFPQVLYGIPMINDAKSMDNQQKKINKSIKPTVMDSELEDPFKKLAQAIMDYLKDKKPYLNPSFSMSDLSIALKAPQHHISYCFNNILKIKFTEIKTQLRVDYARELLESGSAGDLSMDGIGKESGFASRSTFYDAFKAQTGLTPTEFLQQVRLAN